MKKINFKTLDKQKLFFEFLSIFIAVLAAFALNNWNDYRKDSIAEKKILDEISNGLSKDLLDINGNVAGHKGCMRSCGVWNKIMQGQGYIGDSLEDHFSNLTRDFINIQNVAGYTALKSRGLELVRNDELREEIISLYEYHYNTLKKFEEEYQEMQYHKSHFNTLNNILAPNFKFNSAGRIVGFAGPLDISEHDRAIVRSIILRIYKNRVFILQYYKQLEYKLKHLQNSIEFEINGYFK